MVKTITPKQGAELKRLYVGLAGAYSRAGAALRVTRLPLGGKALDWLIEEDEKATALMRRIKKIQGR